MSIALRVIRAFPAFSTVALTLIASHAWFARSAPLPSRTSAACPTPFTITFDDLAEGTRVSDTYSDCISFGMHGSQCNVPEVLIVGSEAQSGTKVGRITNCAEFTPPFTKGQFTALMNHVAVYVGLFDFDVSTSTTVLLTAYDVLDNMVGQSSDIVTRGAGFHTPLTVKIAENTIDHIKISSPDASVNIGIDDLNFSSRNPPSAVDDVLAPNRFALHPSEPNPAVTFAVIEYDVPPDAGPVALRVFDAQGRLIRTLVAADPTSGHRSVRWDLYDEHAHRVRAGLYFSRLSARHAERMQKMLVLD